MEIKRPSQAPYFVLGSRGIPTGPGNPGAVVVKWETLLQASNYAAQLTELGNAFA